MQKAARDSQFRFSQANRLKTKIEFQSVFDKPTKVFCQPLLGFCRTNQKNEPRLGVVISKHIVNRAHQRNQIRRIIRESFRHHKETLKGLDIVVLVRSKCDTLDKKALRNTIDKLWQILIKSCPTS